MARSNIELARLFYRIEADAKGLSREVNASERVLGRLTKFIAQNPVAALSSLGLAAAAAGLKLSAMAARFEKEMAEVSTLVDTNSVDMRQLADDILGLFRALPIESLSDLTRGLYNVVSAGIPAGDAITFLRTAAEASIGGVTSVNTAVDGLTSAVNAFSEQGLTATDAADTFFTAIRAGKTTFAELSSSLGQAAPLAANLGVSFDDLLAAAATLTLGGLNTAEAFTALRGIFANLLKPSTELVRVYPDLAKQFNAASLESKGLQQFLRELAPAIGDNSDKAVKLFGNVRGLNGALSLVTNEGEKVEGVFRAMRDRTGSAAEAFEKMVGTTEAQAQILKNQLNVEMLNLGRSILPTVNAALREANSLLSFWLGADARDLSSNLVKQFDAIRRNLDHLPPASAAARQAILELEEGIDKLVEVRGFSVVSDKLTKLSDAELPRLRLALVRAGLSADATSGQSLKFARALDILNTEMERRGIPLSRDQAIVAGELAEAQKRTTGTAKGAGEEIVRLTAAQRRAVEASQQLTEEQKASVLQTGILTDSTREFVEKAMKEAGKAAKETAKRLAELRAEVEQTFAKETSTLIDDTAVAIEKFRKEARAVRMPQAEIEEFTNRLRVQGTVLESIRLSASLNADVLSSPDAELALIQVGDALDTIRRLMRDIPRDTEAWHTAQAEVERLTTLQSGLQARINRELSETVRLNAEVVANAIEGVRVLGVHDDLAVSILASQLKIDEAEARALLNRKESSKSIGQIVAGVADVARGALGVAQAFGVINREAASTLNSVVSIAESLPQALSGDPTAIVKVLGELTNVLGGVLGIGESPGERIRRELVAKNTAALEVVAREVGNLSQDLGSGATFSGIEDALAAAFGRGEVRGGDFLVGGRKQSFNALLGAELAKRGLSLSQLEELAKTLNIDLGGAAGQPNIVGLQQLLQAIRGVEFGQFGQDFAGQREFIRAAIGTGASTRESEFGLLANLAASQGVTGITSRLAGLDVTTEAGRAGALEALRQLIRDLNAGTVGKKEFGGATGPEFLALVQDLIAILADPEKAIGAFTLADPTVQESFALTVGDSVNDGLDAHLGIGSPHLALLERIAGNTDGLLAPPPVGLVGAQAGPGLTLDLSGFTVNVTTGLGGGDPEAIGSAVASAVRDAALRAVDEALGTSYLRAQQAAGSAARTL